MNLESITINGFRCYNNI